MITMRLIPMWLRRLLTTPLDQLGRWQRVLRYAIDLTRHCTGELRHDKAGQMAAALTYHTLFSILPTIILAMVILHGFVRAEDRLQFKHFVVDTLLPQTTMVAGETVPTDRLELNEARDELAQRVEQLMDRISNFNLGGVGVVGLLVFIYGATALLETIERLFNSIFAVPRSRPWYLRLPMYYTVITLAPLMLIFGQVTQSRMLALLEQASWTAWLVAPAAYLLPFLSVWLILFLLYILLPNTTVPKRAAATGSLVASVVWVLAKEGFQFYVSHAAISTFYGALALLPLFLLWLWLSWLIILFGLELTYTLSAMGHRQLKHLALRELEQQVINPAWVIPLAARIADAFEKGQPALAHDLSVSLAASRKVTQRLLQTLIEANIAVRLDPGQTTVEQYSLARPADHIFIDELLQAADRLLPPQAISDSSPAWRLVRQMHQTHLDQAARMTLADLLNRPVPAARPS
jgi:membrane protein